MKYKKIPSPFLRSTVFISSPDRDEEIFKESLIASSVYRVNPEILSRCLQLLFVYEAFATRMPEASIKVNSRRRTTT